MSQLFDLKPEHSTKWEDILRDDAVRPHPTSTKEELWMWINDHADLLSNLRQRYLDQLKPVTYRRGK